MLSCTAELHRSWGGGWKGERNVEGPGTKVGYLTRGFRDQSSRSGTDPTREPQSSEERGHTPECSSWGLDVHLSIYLFIPWSRNIY